MPSIGSVRSVALEGGEGAPVFEAIKQTKKVAAKVDKTAEKIAAQDKQIADLSAALAKLLATQDGTAEAPEAEPEKELTSGEKAAKTRAENKAKAGAEADKDSK